MDFYEKGVELFDDYKDYPLLPSILHHEMVALAGHLSDYPPVYDEDGIGFEIQLLRPSQIAAAWGLINAGLISHEFSEFKLGFVFFRRSRELAEWLKEQELRDTNSALPTDEKTKPSTPRLTVDLARKTVTLDGTKYDVSSDNAIRWVKVLAEHPGEWISGPQLEEHDSKLMKARPDRWKQQYLPDAIRGLIDSETGKGSRIRL